MKETYSLLLTKSKNNQDVAQMAVSKKYFDPAASRFYYSIYQRILNFLYSEKKNFNPTSTHGGSHNKVLDEFKEFICKEYIKTKKIDKSFAYNLSKLTYLKLFRVDADYSNSKTIDEEKFKKEYMPCYNFCRELLETVENS